MCIVLCSSQVNTFQLVFVTDDVESYAIYNYGDVQWVNPAFDTQVRLLQFYWLLALQAELAIKYLIVLSVCL